MIDNIGNDTSLKLSSLQKTSMEYVAITLLNNGYLPAFVAGVLGNIQSEGVAGMFEGIDQTTRSISNYANYAGKNIRTIGIQSAQELETACAATGYSQQFGLGAIQWTGSRTQTLLDCYKEVCGNNNFPTELECLEAENLCVARELNDSYYHNRVYQYWLQNYSSGNAEAAGEVVCRRYEIPANTDYEATTRGGQADLMYKVMIGQ